MRAHEAGRARGIHIEQLALVELPMRGAAQPRTLHAREQALELAVVQVEDAAAPRAGVESTILEADEHVRSVREPAGHLQQAQRL